LALNTPVVDLITKPLPGDENCRIVLYIIDSGGITDPPERREFLRVKLVRYLEYVVSPQFRKEIPGIEPRHVLVRVLHVNPPTDSMAEIIRIGPSNDPGNRMRVEFGDYNEFMQKLKIPRPT
jgi:hypothetical protein